MIFASTAAAGPETVHTLVFNGGGPLWLQLLVWLAGAAVVAMTVINHRRLQPRRRRIGMISLRGVLVLLLILLYYQPSLLEERVATHRNTVVVLADTSTSMGLKHDGDETRADLSRAWIASNRSALESLATKHDLVLYTFNSEVTDDTAALGESTTSEAALEPKSGETSYLEAFREVRARLRNRDIGAVIALSDGIDSTAEGRRSEPGAELTQTLRDLKAPVTVLGTATDTSIRDIAVSQLSSNNFAFLLNATQLEAVIEVHGYGAGQFPVRLLENGVELATEMVATDETTHIYRVKFEFVPKKLGKQVYTVSVEPRADEVWAKNNQKTTIINIVRDKIRVVQIVGQPSWDQRHLRNLLKENPNVDLVSFFILVNRFNYQPLDNNETSLIPFPAKELFEDELGGFDLLIFQNFNYGPFQTRQYLPNIAQFVRDGGAFAMVGGPLSLSAGDYYGTEIVDVLPVEIPPNWGEKPTVDKAVFSPQLTESGRFHPISRLVLDPSQNRSVWRDLPQMEGANLATGLKPNSVVLVEHPTLKMADAKPQPIVSIREVGKGRSMVVATDSTWHWAFKGGSKTEGGESQDAHYYARFWENAIRWLIRDPELDMLKVRSLRENVPLGQQAEVLISAFLPDYRPAAGQKLEIVVRLREPSDGPGQGVEVARQGALVTDPQGEVRWRFEVARAGVYEVEARADLVEGRQTVATDLFVGTDTNPELERIVADPRFVTAIAEMTGGIVAGPSVSLGDIPILEPTVMRVRNRAYVELWNSTWALLILASLFALEWWLRRRYGYL